MVILCIPVTLVPARARAVSHGHEPHIAGRSSARAYDRTRVHWSTCSLRRPQQLQTLAAGAWYRPACTFPWIPNLSPTPRHPLARNPLTATARRSECIIMGGCSVALQPLSSLRSASAQAWLAHSLRRAELARVFGSHGGCTRTRADTQQLELRKSVCTDLRSPASTNRRHSVGRWLFGGFCVPASILFNGWGCQWKP